MPALTKSVNRHIIHNNDCIALDELNIEDKGTKWKRDKESGSRWAQDMLLYQRSLHFIVTPRTQNE
jgi:hypothetical protein